MEMELKKLPNYQNLAPKEVDKVIKAFIKDLQDKYNNLLGIDKVYNLKLSSLFIIDCLGLSLNR
jgi:hypothetical protein